MGHGLGDFLINSSVLTTQAEARGKEELALLKAKMKEELALAEQRMKEELAQQAQVFAIRETALTQELSSLHQSEKHTTRQLFDKGQKAI